MADCLWFVRHKLNSLSPSAHLPRGNKKGCNYLSASAEEAALRKHTHSRESGKGVISAAGATPRWQRSRSSASLLCKLDLCCNNAPCVSCAANWNRPAGSLLLRGHFQGRLLAWCFNLKPPCPTAWSRRPRRRKGISIKAASLPATLRRVFENRAAFPANLAATSENSFLCSRGEIKQHRDTRDTSWVIVTLHICTFYICIAWDAFSNTPISFACLSTHLRSALLRRKLFCLAPLGDTAARPLRLRVAARNASRRAAAWQGRPNEPNRIKLRKAAMIESRVCIFGIFNFFSRKGGLAKYCSF